jgi:hypothetical protein
MRAVLPQVKSYFMSVLTGIFCNNLKNQKVHFGIYTWNDLIIKTFGTVNRKKEIFSLNLRVSSLSLWGSVHIQFTNTQYPERQMCRILAVIYPDACHRYPFRHLDYR